MYQRTDRNGYFSLKSSIFVLLLIEGLFKCSMIIISDDLASENNDKHFAFASCNADGLHLEPIGETVNPMDGVHRGVFITCINYSINSEHLQTESETDSPYTFCSSVFTVFMHAKFHEFFVKIHKDSSQHDLS